MNGFADVLKMTRKLDFNDDKQLNNYRSKFRMKFSGFLSIRTE